MNPQIIAFYLPQFHRTKENDEWWGKGFTEWTNVAMAKPLFRGHYQPKIPTELGFYDLRFSENREAQAILAQKAGISAFCYWHYWFGNGKKLLNMPFEEVVRLKKPDMPFCLAWANHSWYKKSWKTNKSNFELPRGSKLLVEQTYPGIEDIDAHFYYLLDAFRDKRYYKIDGRLLFVIYAPLKMIDWQLFRDRWQELAHKEPAKGILHYLTALKNSISLKPKVVEYEKAIELMKSNYFKEENVYPTIIPNWDHTPRSGNFGTCFNNCTPELFAKHVSYILETIRPKKIDNQVVFLKSWNEWGEGNYMEPDMKYGDGYIRTLYQCLELGK